MERDLELLSTSHLQQLLQDQGVCTDSNFLQGPGMRKKLLSFAATLAAIKLGTWYLVVVYRGYGVNHRAQKAVSRG